MRYFKTHTHFLQHNYHAIEVVCSALADPRLQRCQEASCFTGAVVYAHVLPQVGVPLRRERQQKLACFWLRASRHYDLHYAEQARSRGKQS
jgi:hypothetical protein